MYNTEVHPSSEPALNFSKCLRSLCRMLRILLLDMPNTSACLCADRLGLQLMDANTQAMFLGVWSEDGRPGWLLHDRASSMPLPYLLTDCLWTWGFLLIQFRVKSTWSLCNGTCPNKQFHSIHILYFPETLCWLTLQVTALVWTPVHNDTLAEKHIIKIFKCFTISAAPCI